MADIGSPARLLASSCSERHCFPRERVDEEVVTWMGRARRRPCTRHAWASCNHNIGAILQEGPTYEDVFECGFVALQMAADHLHGSECGRVEHMLEHAVNREYTREGEMFFPEELASVARCSFDFMKATVCPLRVADLARVITRGGVVMVPYDAAPNHEPRSASPHGANAHWCLIKGVVAPVHRAPALPFPAEHPEWDGEGDVPPVPFIYELTERGLAGRGDLDAAKVLGDVIRDDGEEACKQEGAWHGSYVVALHGKSKRQHVWSFEALRESCYSLNAPDTRRIETGKYRIPETLATLRGTMIALERADS